MILGRKTEQIAALEARVSELEATLNRERLQAAQDARRWEIELQRLCNQVSTLEFEVDHAHKVIYELDAQRATRLQREKQVRELLQEGMPKTRVARQVFGYGTGSAFDFVQRVIRETPALVNPQG